LKGKVCVVLLGPPGAGKGTQARFIQERVKIPHISTGDLLRKSVEEKTPLGKKAAGYIEKGKLVPDKVMLEMMAQRLSENDCTRGFILDGFPRTVPQAEGLETLLRNMDSLLNHVLFVNVSRSTTIQRLGGRRTCKGCGALYHLELNPPTQPDLCDRCRGELFQREDDREETIAARLDVYEKQTTPLIEYYRTKGLLREIDGVGEVEEIKARLIHTLELEGT